MDECGGNLSLLNTDQIRNQSENLNTPKVPAVEKRAKKKLTKVKSHEPKRVWNGKESRADERVVHRKVARVEFTLDSDSEAENRMPAPAEPTTKRARIIDSDDE
jgi:hypothetical protein